LSEELRKWLLGRGTSKTIAGAFEELVESEINISAGIRSQASASHNHLREFLADENARDWTFPRILSRNDSDFLGGSFARHSKIWPLDDIDIYFPLDGFNLTYFQNGYRLPYSVTTDNVLASNPLLTPRWTIGGNISSIKLVEEFAKVIKRHYPDSTEVKPNGEAVSIRMSYGSGENSEGLGYDVVPCFHLAPDDSSQRDFYLMPDGKGGWIRTNPRFDTSVSEDLQALSNGVFRKSVKLVKYWNANRCANVFNSYYVELAIMRAFISVLNAGRRPTIAEGVSIGFGALLNALKSGNQVAWIESAPAVEPGCVQAEHLQWLDYCTKQAEYAIAHEALGNSAEAIAKWKTVFGDIMPGITA
jgi:hypothetical protein